MLHVLGLQQMREAGRGDAKLVVTGPLDGHSECSVVCLFVGACCGSGWVVSTQEE